MRACSFCSASSCADSCIDPVGSSDMVSEPPDSSATEDLWIKSWLTSPKGPLRLATTTSTVLKVCQRLIYPEAGDLFLTAIPLSTFSIWK